MNPTDMIPVTLNADNWNQVLSLLSDGPYKTAAPLIQTIQNQCMQWDQRHQMMNDPRRVQGAPFPADPDNVVPMMNEAGE